LAEITILDAYGRPCETRAQSSPVLDWLSRTYGMGEGSTAGEHVSAHSAMTVMTFFACVRNIAEDMAKLPKRIRKRNGREYVDLSAHPLNRIFRRPNPETDSHTFWETLFAHACTTPGGYAEIIRDGSGRVSALYNLDPSTMRVVRNDRTGEILYHVRGMHPNEGLRQSAVLHIHGLGYDAMSGYSMPQLASQLLGTAIALQKYTGSFFGNGATPSGVLQHPAALTDESAERLRRQFMKRYSGASNAHSILTLEEGMTWSQISTSPEDAQATDLSNVTIVDICRMFRMPPHKVQHLENAHYANIEQDNILYATDTLDGWRSRLKSEIEFKLMTEDELDEGVYVDISLKALMRGDAAARTAFYKDLFYMGAISANDILELEDENPVEYGDRRFMQANLIPTDKVDEVLAKQTAPKPAPAADPPDAPDDDEPAAARVREAFRLVFENKIAGILRVETGKAKQSKADSDFYAEHRGYVKTCMTEIIGAANMALGIPEGEPVADWYAAGHCERSMFDVAGNDLTTWQNGTRARLAASALMEKLCNFAA
jgi:HK97 family phage portal protein